MNRLAVNTPKYSLAARQPGQAHLVHPHIMERPLSANWHRSGAVHRACFNVASGALNHQTAVDSFRPKSVFNTYLYWNEPALDSPVEFAHFTYEIAFSIADREQRHLLRPFVRLLNHPFAPAPSEEKWAGIIAASRFSHSGRIARNDVAGLLQFYDHLNTLVDTLENLASSATTPPPIFITT